MIPNTQKRFIVKDKEDRVEPKHFISHIAAAIHKLELMNKGYDPVTVDKRQNQAYENKELPKV